MRNTSFIPGLVIILIAILFLLNNFGLFNLDWNVVWRLWPLLFIIAGLSLLISNRRSFWIGVGLLIILVCLGLYALNRGGWEQLKIVSTQDEVTSHLSEPYENVSARTQFIFDGGAGNYTIGGTTDQLVQVDTTSTQGEFSLARTDSDGLTRLNLKQQNLDKTFSFHRVKNSASVALNVNPLWELELNTGAASVNADLSPYKVDNFTVKAGASSITLKLGDQQQEMRGTISTGAASVTIHVPQTVGCEIQASTGLSNQDFNGFTKNGSTYRTEGFDESSKKIFLTIQTGVSSIKVDRY